MQNVNNEDEIKRYWDVNYPKEVPKHVDYDEFSLGDMLRNTSKNYPDSQAIYFEGWRCTYKDLDLWVDQFATALSKLGIKKDDVVLIDLPNVPQFVIVYYAIVRIGAIANPIIPLNKYTEIVHQTNDSEGKLLIVLDILYEEHLHGRDLSKMPTLKDIILTGVVEYLPKAKAVLGTALGKVPRMKEWPVGKIENISYHKFQDVLQMGVTIDLPDIKINPKEDVSTLIYTGGTTGLPKGCKMSHYNFVVNCQQGNIWVQNQLPETAKHGEGGMFVILPLAHEFALSIAMNIGVFMGFKLILFVRPPEKISNVLKLIKKEGATYGPGVPTLWNAIANDPDSAKYKGKLTSLVACFSGAAPLPLEVKEKYEEVTSANIVEGFGMSETSPILTVTPIHKYKPNTVGFPVSDTLIKIVDVEDGTKILKQCTKDNCDDCGAEEAQYIGEICGCGPQVFLGYLNRPKETEYALRKDSKGRTWYYTTDIGCIDKDGYLHIKDRKRDMIKYKGHSVFPREVEDLIYLNPAVNEVGVIGVPDPESGETIKAYISLKPEYQGKITEEELMEWCKSNISAFKYPRIIEIIPEIPKSIVGKILRRELRTKE